MRVLPFMAKQFFAQRDRHTRHAHQTPIGPRPMDYDSDSDTDMLRDPQNACFKDSGTLLSKAVTGVISPMTAVHTLYLSFFAARWLSASSAAFALPVIL